MYGRKLLYKVDASPMTPHIRINRVVDHAILLVANSDSMCSPESCELLDKSPFFLFAPTTSAPGAAYSPPTSRTAFRRSSTVRVHWSAFPLNLAILWMTSTASSSRPFPMRYLGLSWNLKTKKRTDHNRRVSPPRANIKYLHPMLSARVHEMASVWHEKLTINGQATCWPCLQHSRILQDVRSAHQTPQELPY